MGEVAGMGPVAPPLSPVFRRVLVIVQQKRTGGKKFTPKPWCCVPAFSIGSASTCTRGLLHAPQDGIFDMLTGPHFVETKWLTFGWSQTIGFFATHEFFRQGSGGYRKGPFDSVHRRYRYRAKSEAVLPNFRLGERR